MGLHSYGLHSYGLRVAAAPFLAFRRTANNVLPIVLALLLVLAPRREVLEECLLCVAPCEQGSIFALSGARFLADLAPDITAGLAFACDLLVVLALRPPILRLVHVVRVRFGVKRQSAVLACRDGGSARSLRPLSTTTYLSVVADAACTNIAPLRVVVVVSARMVSTALARTRIRRPTSFWIGGAWCSVVAVTARGKVAPFLVVVGACARMASTALARFCAARA